MIKRKITMELNGLHYGAFRAFANRAGTKTTQDVVLRLIECLPEYQVLFRANAPTFDDPSCDFQRASQSAIPGDI